MEGFESYFLHPTVELNLRRLRVVRCYAARQLTGHGAEP